METTIEGDGKIKKQTYIRYYIMNRKQKLLAEERDAENCDVKEKTNLFLETEKQTIMRTLEGIGSDNVKDEASKHKIRWCFYKYILYIHVCVQQSYRCMCYIIYR